VGRVQPDLPCGCEEFWPTGILQNALCVYDLYMLFWLDWKLLYFLFCNIFGGKLNMKSTDKNVKCINA